MKDLNLQVLREKLREAILILPHFLKNPVATMRALPDWDWATMIVLQAAFALICSVLGNVLERDIWGLVTGFVVAPIRIVILTGVVAGCFYYIFKFFFHREIAYKAIYLHLVFAAIPAQIVAILHFVFAPISLIGLGASLSLLYIGFSDNFYLDRVRLKKMMLSILAVAAVFWILQTVRMISHQDALHIKATPESLDILEKELSK